MSPRGDLPRILYVGGLGRSGSTLLERAVAQLPGVFGAGEVVYLWQRGILNNEKCGCGSSFRDCQFWTSVGEIAFGGWGGVDVGRVRDLAGRVDDVRHVPRMLLGLETAGFRAALDEYLSYYLRLYAAIREVSGCDVIVDSSKITSLAYVLSHVDELRLAMIHMIRDARAVAYSWTKVVKRPEITSNDAYMPRYSPAYMAMLYNGHHVLLELLRLRGVPSVRIRYEDFAEDPEMSLSDVARLLGRTFDRKALFASQPGDPPKLQLPASHTVSGNPSRFASGDVAVRRDEAWRQKMPARQRVMVGAITAPVQAAYGYLNAERKAALRPDGSDTRSSAR